MILCRVSDIVLLALLTLLSCCKAKGPICKQVTHCSCKTSDGKEINLQPLSTGKSPRFTKRSKDSLGFTYDWSWDPCRTVPCGTNTGVSVCQKFVPANPGLIYDLGDQKTAKFANDEKGLYIGYTNTADKVTRATKVYLVCSTSDPVFTVAGESTPGSLQYEMTLSTKEACPSGGTSQAGGGLSIGSILLIVVFGIIIVYIAVGILVNIFVRKQRGTDVIPNKEFWILIPGLTKDGFVFVKSKVMKSSSDSNYGNI